LKIHWSDFILAVDGFLLISNFLSQVPFLRDANTGVSMFESADIIKVRLE
jgi:hypothetical protein